MLVSCHHLCCFQNQTPTEQTASVFFLALSLMAVSFYVAIQYLLAGTCFCSVRFPFKGVGCVCFGCLVPRGAVVLFICVMLLVLSQWTILRRLAQVISHLPCRALRCWALELDASNISQLPCCSFRQAPLTAQFGYPWPQSAPQSAPPGASARSAGFTLKPKPKTLKPEP